MMSNGVAPLVGTPRFVSMKLLVNLVETCGQQKQNTTKQNQNITEVQAPYLQYVLYMKYVQLYHYKLYKRGAVHMCSVILACHEVCFTAVCQREV